jgi:hopanoid biosynthesis associated protein HpnK
MKQLIVNADDFGLTSGVSRGIMAAHVHGIVTSASLMANGNVFEEAVALARRSPQLGIGVHLNLTQGKPVAPASEVRSLLNSNGRLSFSPYRLGFGILTGTIRVAEIATELQAQISKIVGAGISPTHLDGHKHVHVLPGISEVVIRLAQEYGIPSIRCPIEEASGVLPVLQSNWRRSTDVLKQYLIGRAVSSFARRFKRNLAEAGLNCPGPFRGLTQTGFLDEDNLVQILKRLPEGTSELMCHPGYADAELLSTGTRLLSQRMVELRALSRPEIRKLAGDEGIQFVSYCQLPGQGRANEAPARGPEVAVAQCGRRVV